MTKTEVEKLKFHQYRSPALISDKDINKIVVSNKVPFGKRGCKYFVAYEDGKNVRLLYIIFPKMTAYRRDFGETRQMSFATC